MKERVLTGRKFLLSLSALLALVFLVAFFSPAAAAPGRLPSSSRREGSSSGGMGRRLPVRLLRRLHRRRGCGCPGQSHRRTQGLCKPVSVLGGPAGRQPIRGGGLQRGGSAHPALPSLSDNGILPALPAAADSFLLFDCNGQGRFYYSQDGNFLYTATSNQDIQPLARQDWLFPTFLEITPSGTFFAATNSFISGDLRKHRRQIPGPNKPRRKRP